MSTTQSSLGMRQGSPLTMQRSHGAATGLLLILLGAWGAIIPFVGPYFHYTFGTPTPWFFTYNRLWLDVLPGLAVVLGGLILGPTANRASGSLGAWLALLGGIWFATGPVISQLWRVGGVDAPIGPPFGTHLLPLLEQLGYFFGLGTIITALAAFALGRLSVLAGRDY